MTQKMTGVVEVISKTRKGIKIGNNWFNNKYPIKDVQKGDNVSFEYETADSGSNFLKSKVTIVAGAAKLSGSKSATSYDVGAGSGMAVNNAILLSIAQKKYDDFNYVYETAREIYLLTEQFKKDASKGFKDDEPEALSQDDDDDDSPFSN
jgi:hypothetical protein